MKKRIFILSTAACFLLFAHTLMAQTFSGPRRNAVGVHAGWLDPKDTTSGMMFGAMLITEFDNAVDLALGFDVFQRTYSDETDVVTETEGDTHITTGITRVDYSRTALPLYFSFKIKIPAAREGYIQKFGYFIRANISYQFLISEEKNYVADKSEKRKYKGLGWQAGGGLFYRVGSRSTLFGEAFLNSCIVSRDVSNPTELLPVTERVDLSAIGVRCGVELDLR